LKGELADASVAEGSIKLACPHCWCFGGRPAQEAAGRGPALVLAPLGSGTPAAGLEAYSAEQIASTSSTKRLWLVRTAV